MLALFWRYADGHAMSSTGRGRGGADSFDPRMDAKENESAIGPPMNTDEHWLGRIGPRKAFHRKGRKERKG